jgi:hypothetical protein
MAISGGKKTSNLANLTHYMSHTGFVLVTNCSIQFSLKYGIFPPPIVLMPVDKYTIQIRKPNSAE